MLHQIPAGRAGPATEEMSHAVEACVHCGFCLPTCPTYAVMGEEMNSPRGRIFLMKEALEGRLATAEAQPFIDQCLGCLACETACPSGVKYGELLSPYRAWTTGGRRADDKAEAIPGGRIGNGVVAAPLGRRLQRALLLATLPFPARFRAVVALGRIARPLRGALPRGMRAMLEMVPARVPPAQRLAEVYPAIGEKRGRVALLAGCAQQVLAPEINAATIEVLRRNGVEVVVPRAQACCGALALHVGVTERARATARRNLQAFPRDVDAILTNAAGCGSGLHEYGLLFKGEPEHAEAEAFAKRCLDVSVYLDRLGLRPPPALRAADLPRLSAAAPKRGEPVGGGPGSGPHAVQPLKVAYHDACHLAHAQKVRLPPRRLLAAIPNIELVEPLEWELCCGSAGTYNLEQPEVAAQLGRRKAQNLLATGAQVIATGNIGCLTQIAAHLGRLGHPRPILHPMQLLASAYAGQTAPASPSS